MNHMTTDDHDTFRGELAAYLDGELTELRSRLVAGHLAGCDLCRAEVQNLEGLGRLLRAYRPETVPSSQFERSFAAAFRREARGRAPLPARPIPVPEPVRPRSEGTFGWLLRPVMVPLSVATVAAAATLFFRPEATDVVAPTAVSDVSAPALSGAEELVELVAEDTTAADSPTPDPDLVGEPAPVIAEGSTDDSVLDEDAPVVEAASVVDEVQVAP